jgi:hypothetical protein
VRWWVLWGVGHFTRVKTLLIIVGFVVAGFFVSALLLHWLQTRIPSDLKRLTELLSGEWRLLSWSHQPMGWLGRFEVRGRRFDVSTHRDESQIFELVGESRQAIGSDGPKSPEQIYELLAKTVA